MQFIEGSKPTNKKHIANLLKLADFLESDKIPPPRFHMGDFAFEVAEEQASAKRIEELMYQGEYIRIEIDEAKPKKYATCNTVACAIGHGPMAGIKVYKDYDWFSYAGRVFGVYSDDAAFDWLFSSDWSKTDNTPQGAAKRIRIYVENGVPFNYIGQQYEDEPLMYKL